MSRILIVRCSKCRTKIFKYMKVGSGRLWHCWKSKILEDYSIRRGEQVVCPKCGSIIGIEKKAYIKLIKGAYSY
ncbi:MAG: hypothetical protein Q6363_000300 [Candidatus Njordarchaeota archaeon]